MDAKGEPFDQATLYWCDPEKNTECRKTGCRYVLRPCEGGACDATFIRAFARLDEKGEPMIHERLRDRKRRKENV